MKELKTVIVNDNIEYGVVELGGNECQIRKVTTRDGSPLPNILSIPSKLEQYKVVSIGNDVFAGRSELRGIKLPNTLTDIGDRAFCETSIRNITLPVSVWKMGCDVFRNCKRLKRVIMSDMITEVNSGVFAGCEAIEKVRLPFFLPKIESYTFAGCIGLKEIEIPPFVKTIEPKAFMDCDSLSHITFLNCNCAVKDEAFYGCQSFRNIKIHA